MAAIFASSTRISRYLRDLYFFSVRKPIFSKKYTSASFDLSSLSKILQSARVCACDERHLLRFSCFTYVGGIYKMSCAGSIVWSAALALSFEPDACNINFIKTAHLVKLGNRLGVFHATYITPQIVKCWQTEYLRQKCISRKWTVFFKVHKYKPQVFLIYAWITK